MNQYINNLSKLEDRIFLTDGGLETTLIFEHGFALPEFASFTLLKDKKGRAAMYDYYLPYIDLAKQNQFGFILEGSTWRASQDWGKKLGYNAYDLEKANFEGIELLARLRQTHENDTTPMLISGCIGPRGDGYTPAAKMDPWEAQQYHTIQIQTLSRTEADLISAFTINYTEEAIGITRAAQQFDIPVVISFTLETDGRLPSGQPLGAAIKEVDKETQNGPAYYMINCAHPSHFKHVLLTEEDWKGRIHALRANASCKSHAELDDSEELDSGNPAELGSEYIELIELLPNLNIFGGCCGTDIRHLREICGKFVESAKRQVILVGA
jgi:S-methylmethionine-dependent homocysteine/selenocysteine methylase